METKPLAIVTGASSGIGEALAREIAADGYDLVLVARRGDRLDVLASELGSTHVVAADLSTAAGCAAVEDAVGAIGRPVDVLVNNAGFGQQGDFVDIDRERLTAMVDLNVRAVVDLTHRFLPAMLMRRRGGVLNVASTAAFQPGPRLQVYYATKAFVLSLSEALTEECRGKGVTITALCPGPTVSEFKAHAAMEKSRLFKYSRAMSAEDVAKIGWRGFKSGRRAVITGVPNKLGAAAAKVIPHRLLLPVVKQLQTDVD